MANEPELTRAEIQTRVRVTLGGCWEWSGKRSRKGYGRLVRRINGKHSYWQAHRVVYSSLFGAIGPGLLVCHRCDNPPCVNPDHLFLGTAADNLNDCIRKGRRPMTAATRPEGNPKAKLSPTRAKEMKHAILSGRLTQVAASKEYGISRSSIWAMLKGLTYKAVG
jgi:hypothetical protein